MDDMWVQETNIPGLYLLWEREGRTLTMTTVNPEPAPPIHFLLPGLSCEPSTPRQYVQDTYWVSGTYSSE